MIVDAVKFVPNDNPNDDGFWAVLGVPSEVGETPPYVILPDYHVVARRQVSLEWHPIGAPSRVYFDLPNCPGVPPLTPFEVKEQLKDSLTATICRDGWEFSLDGPQMSPPEAWFPICTKNDYVFTAEGDVDDELTPKTNWVCLTKDSKVVSVPLVNPLIVTAKDIEDMANYPTLGPMWGAARRITDEVVSSFADNDFKGVVAKAVEEFTEQLNKRVEDSLWLDLEHNLHGRFWDGVQQVIHGLLVGDKWTLDTYIGADSLLARRPELLKAIAEHIPEKIVGMQVKELQDRIATLEKSLEWHKSQSIRY